MFAQAEAWRRGVLAPNRAAASRAYAGPLRSVESLKVLLLVNGNGDSEYGFAADILQRPVDTVRA